MPEVKHDACVPNERRRFSLVSKIPLTPCALPRKGAVMLKLLLERALKWHMPDAFA